MAIDVERIRAFLDESDIRAMVAIAVRRVGFQISWVLSYRRELWGLYLKPNRNLKELLGTNREILLWVSEFHEFQPRTLSQAMEIITGDQPRLCDEFAMVLTAEPYTRRHVQEASEGTPIQFAGFCLTEIRDLSTRGDSALLLAIQQQLFTKDLYYISNAITNRRAFFGRETVVRDLLSTLRIGNTHIALFGLRKTGKTSLLYRLIDELQSDRSVLHVHVDLQRLDAIRPTSDYFLWSLGEQLFAAHRAVRDVRGLRLFGQFERFPKDFDIEQVFEDFDHDIRLLFARTSVRYLFMLDEIELMSPETPGSAWGDAFVRVWRFLRGIDQTYPGRLRFLVSGTNPSCIEVNRLGGRENPAYNYFSKRYLASLNHAESADLLQTLGNRMGLDWNDDAIERAHSAVGGHPFLLRLLGSAIHKTKHPRESTQLVTRTDVVERIPQFLRDVNSTLSQMVEVLADNYQNEFYLLETLAAGRLGTYRELAQGFPDDVAHLIGYGLVSNPDATASLSVEVLQTWLQNRKRARASSDPLSEVERFEPGTRIDGFCVEKLLGSGGFGAVYRATREGHESPVALKVLKLASLAQLQREVEVLSAVSHTSIVKILDYGKLSTGHVYLATEYLDGLSLAESCTRATRLSTEVATNLLRCLLSALVILHPNHERVVQLRSQQELSIEEYKELEIAMHGFVHRDIKPENIIIVKPHRAVLIDFGISSRVSTDVRTVSGTKGYFPPDGLPMKWSPDVDLYQLGVTMAQAMCGIQMDPDHVEELRRVLQADELGSVGEVVLRLFAPQQSERFESAKCALKMLGG